MEDPPVTIQQAIMPEMIALLGGTRNALSLEAAGTAAVMTVEKLVSII